MRRLEPSEYLRGLRLVAKLEGKAEGDGLINTLNALYKEQFAAFMERLHECEKEHAKAAASAARLNPTQPATALEAKATKAAVADVSTDKVVEMCKELAANWKD